MLTASLWPDGQSAHGREARFHYVLLVIGTAHDHVALHGIVDAENAIELGDLSGVCLEVDEGVVALDELDRKSVV